MDILKELINNLHFIRPLILWGLPAVLLIVWLILKNNSKDDGWSKICDPHLLEAIKISTAGQGSRWTLLLWPVSIIAIIAIAGPAFRKMPTPVIKNQSALILVLDVSRSMLADDIKPNRLERAKYKVNDILEQRKDGQTALIVYAGDAFVVTPLTDDTETIALMLKAITPDIMPVQGSRADIALKKSQDLLHQAGYVTGDIILISDGVNSSKTLNIATDLAKNRIRTSVLAIGSKAGAPIPTAQGFVKDKAGNIVIPKLKVKDLKKVANAGRGRFSQITGDSTDINYLLPSAIKQEDKQKDNKADNNNEDAFDTEKYIDEGPWLSLLLLPLLLLMFRKGVLLSLFLIIGLQSPQSSYALGWNDLWQNSNQKAAELIEKQQFGEALETATTPQLKATAAFRNKDYQQAKELFNDGSADGFYNQGNALAANGELKEALESYEKSLKMNPNDEDALYNKEQVENALKEQEKQEKQEKQEQDKKDQDKKENKEDKEQQDQQDQNDQESDSENKEGEQSKEQQDKEGNPDQQDKKKDDQADMTEEEKKKQQEQEKKLAEEDKKAAEKEAQEQQEKQEIKMTPEEMAENAENKEAIEQWLRRIPDDPGGLLRRKFYYQYNQQNTKPDETENW